MMRLRLETGGRLGETVGGFLGAWSVDVSEGDILDAESSCHGVVGSWIGPEGQGGIRNGEITPREGENSASWLGRDRRRYL